MTRLVSAFLPVLALILSLCAPVSQAKWHYETASHMGTEISVQLWHPDENTAQRAITAVFEEMQRIDQTYSPWIASSELSRANKLASKGPQPISDEFAQLIDTSLHYSRLSKGAFDITFASAAKLYDYRKSIRPKKSELNKTLPLVSYQQIARDKDGGKERVRFKRPGVNIDLGGLAKGFAVDRAATLVKGFGVRHASISAGGDTYVLGDKRGRPWVIGIKNPRAKNNASTQSQVAIHLPLQDVAVSTSGDYERFFIDTVSGERVHHILNPKTGESASGVASVTIMGERGLDTDPLSTTVFVLGVKEGLALIERLPGFDGIIIDSAGKVFFSSGLQAPQ